MSITQRLFSVHYPYRNPFNARRATALLWTNWVVTAAWLFYTVTLSLPEIFSGVPSAITLLSIILPPAILFLIYRLIQTGYLMTASRLCIALTMIGAIPYAELDAADFLLLTIPFIAAGLLLDRRGFLISTAIAVTIFITGAISQDSTLSLLNSGEVAVYIIVLVLDVAFLFIFNPEIGPMLQEVLTVSDQRQKILHFTNENALIESENAIITRAINLIRDELNYTYAQIFLMDQAGKLARRARVGLGVDSINVSENLNIGDANIISEAIFTKHAVTVSRDDNEVRRTHLLPAVNTAIALPLVYRQHIIGVLDIQNESRLQFRPDEIATLSLLANQLGVMLSQIRERELLRRSLQEQEEIVVNLRNQVQELRQLSRENISGVWDEYRQQRGESAFGFNLQGKDKGLVPASDLPEAMRLVLENGEIHTELVGDERIVSVPIILVGEMLGAMSFVVPKDQPLGQRQLEMIQSVAERLALSLETQRLFEQSQAQALRERKASEAASQLISATDVRSVMNLAAETFNEALGAVQTRIYLQPGILAEMTPTRNEEVASS